MKFTPIRTILRYRSNKIEYVAFSAICCKISSAVRPSWQKCKHDRRINQYAVPQVKRSSQLLTMDCTAKIAPIKQNQIKVCGNVFSVPLIQF